MAPHTDDLRIRRIDAEEDSCCCSHSNHEASHTGEDWDEPPLTTGNDGRNVAGQRRGGCTFRLGREGWRFCRVARV